LTSPHRLNGALPELVQNLVIDRRPLPQARQLARQRVGHLHKADEGAVRERAKTRLVSR